MSESILFDSSTIVRINHPDRLSRNSHFIVPVSEKHTVSESQGIGVVLIILSQRADLALLEWILVQSRPCAIRLNGCIKVKHTCEKHRCFFIKSNYAPMEFRSSEKMNDFFAELSHLVRSAKSTAFVILVGHMNAQVCQLNVTELDLGGVFGVGTRRIENGNRLLHQCVHHGPFLSSTAF